MNLLVPEVDVSNTQIRDLLCPRAMRHSEEKHCVFTRPIFLRSLKETFELFARHVRDSSTDLLRSLLRHSDHVLADGWCHGCLHDGTLAQQWCIVKRNRKAAQD